MDNHERILRIPTKSNTVFIPIRKAVTLRMYTHADQEIIKKASQIFRDAIKQA